LYDDIIAAIRAHGVNLNVAQEISDAGVLFLRVASGFGLAFGTENTARIVPLGGSHWKPVSDLGLEVREIVMWRPEDAEAPLLRPFLDVVRELRSELHAPGEGQKKGEARRRSRRAM